MYKLGVSEVGELNLNLCISILLSISSAKYFRMFHYHLLFLFQGGFFKVLG